MTRSRMQRAHLIGRIGSDKRNRVRRQRRVGQWWRSGTWNDAELLLEEILVERSRRDQTRALNLARIVDAMVPRHEWILSKSGKVEMSE
jgi:hypothetical protein